MTGAGEEDESKNKQCSLIRRSHDRMPCTEKRIGSKRIASIVSLNDLGDYLLVEVLQRLPTAKSAISCKSVCKHWCSLISSDYFVRCFITHHASKNLTAAASVDDGGHSFNSLLGTCRNPTDFVLSYPGCGYSTMLDVSLFNSRRSFLNFLCEDQGPTEVLASSFSDLLLCSVGTKKDRRFYVCNPFTRQYVVIPSINKRRWFFCGLVCEPFYLQDTRHGCADCTVNHEFRFWVVKAKFPVSLDPISHYVLDTYSSETNQWSVSAIPVADLGNPSNLVPYNGRLHWFNGENVFAYDPCDATKSCVLDGSQFRFRYPEDGDYGRHCLGVCQGRLRIMHLLLRREHTLIVWELKNYATWDWSLVHKVNLKTMVSRDNELCKFINEDDKIEAGDVGFHPSDGDIVYLNFEFLIYSYNLRTRKLEFVAENSDGYDYYNSLHFFPVVLPLWPTPLPTLQETFP